MPRKSARKRQSEVSLEKAREVKRGHVPSESTAAAAGIASGEQSDLTELLSMSDDALDTENKDADPSFDLDASMKSDSDYMVERFCEDWISHLDRDDRVSLGLFLSFQLANHLKLGETKAAELASIMINKSDKTIREWRAHFFLNEGEIPENTQGKYQRSGIIWAREDLNKKTTKYIRENADVKGQPNLTIQKFCDWVNEDLLPNETLEPGFPRRISMESGRKWMHELGFEVVSKKKGTFVDGHEREDIVEYRIKFLRRMVCLGFLNPDNAPTEEAKIALPSDLHAPPTEVIEKTIVLFHDETTFQANQDQPTLWAEKGTNVMRPKSRGSGIMVSDFIGEKHCYLELTQEEYEEAKRTNPSIRKHARETLDYGEAKEGYWTSERFMTQIEEAVKIAEVKYPRESGWKVVWIFDHSSCHAAMPVDAVDASKMNVNPGRKQRVMRDAFWEKMNYALGVAKGMGVVLEDRGLIHAT